MNVRRGLLRVWIVASVVWLIGYVTYDWSLLTAGIGCSFGLNEGPWCDFWSPSDYARAFGLPILIPIAVLALGMAVGWAIRGFSRQTSN